MVGRADQVEAVAAKRLGLQLGCVGADGGQGKVGLAAAHALDTGLGQHIGHLDLYARVLRPVSTQHLGQPARCERGQQRNRHPPPAQRQPVGEVGQSTIKLRQHPPRRHLKRQPLGRRLHMAGAAVKQAQAQRGLQLPDQRAESRLRQMAQTSRAGETALLGQRHKGLQLACGDVGAGGFIHLQFICFSNGLI